MVVVSADNIRMSVEVDRDDTGDDTACVNPAR
jgi:hypothetical protein